MLNINILHTSASLIIQENADPDVLNDLKIFTTRECPGLGLKFIVSS